MMFAILKQAFRKSPLEMAAAIEKHIGDGANESYYERVCSMFIRIKDPRLRQALAVTDRLFPNRNPLERVAWLIAALRSGIFD
jgi:hypothetical protein